MAKPGKNASLLLSGIPAAAELLKIRALPAEFARLHDVSRATVSRWISGGLLQLGADGRLDVAAATRAVLERDPARARARVMRVASADLHRAKLDATAARRAEKAARAEVKRLGAAVLELERRLRAADDRVAPLLRRLAETEAGAVAAAAAVALERERPAAAGKLRAQALQFATALPELIAERRESLCVLGSAAEWLDYLGGLRGEAWRRVLSAESAAAADATASPDEAAG